MVVIYDYAFTRYIHILFGIEGARISTSFDNINWHPILERIEALIAHGPDLLCQFLAQTHLLETSAAFLELVSKYRYESSVRFRDVISVLSSRLPARNPTGFNRDRNTRSRFYFEGDDVAAGPNAGWVIAHEGKIEARLVHHTSLAFNQHFFHNTISLHSFSLSPSPRT